MALQILLFQYTTTDRRTRQILSEAGKKIYPVKERKQYDFQLVPDILIIDMEVVLWVGEVSTNLQEQSQVRERFEHTGQDTRFLGRLLTLLCMNSELEPRNFSPYSPNPVLIRPEPGP
jgi:hypothetical protein